VSHPLLPAVIEAVRAAGEAILPYWRSTLAVQQKADNSPVTQADLAAHHLLAERLQKIAPDTALLSEEDCKIPLNTRKSWQSWWLIDPLDGTRGFIEGSEEFTVNVALIEQGRVVFGVAGQPTTGCLWYGGQDYGTFVCPANEPAQMLFVGPPPARGFVLSASRKHSNAAQDALVKAITERFAVERFNISSSLKQCLLAEGKIDLYPRLSPTSQWDTAAAQGVLEGAGCLVLNAETGEHLTYPPTEDLLNPAFIALPACASWRDDVLALAQQALANSIPSGLNPRQ